MVSDKKSKVNRLPIFIYHSGSPSILGKGKDVFKDTEYLFKHTNQIKDEKFKKIIPFMYNGTMSRVTVAVNGGWYCKTNCCQSISQLAYGAKNTRSVFFIPHVGAMSIKKKIEYIKILEKLFSPKLRYLSTIDSPIFKNPLTKKEDRASINSSNATGLVSLPMIGIPSKNHLLVYSKATTSLDRLLHTQLLRPLYQTVTISVNHFDFGITDTSIYSSFEYYQPRLFLKLRKLFPELDDLFLFWLSHTIHGKQINSTYNACPYYLYKPNTTINSSATSILGMFSDTSLAPSNFSVPTSTIHDYLKGIFKPTGFTLTNGLSNCNGLVPLSLIGTRESYKLAILCIAYLHSLDHVFKAFNTTRSEFEKSFK